MYNKNGLQAVCKVMYKKSKKTIFVYVMLFCILFFLLNIFVKPIRNSFYFISQPIAKVFWGAGHCFSDFLAGFLNKDALKQENEELTKENFDLRKQIIDLKFLEQENEKLQKIFASELNEKFDLIKADVIAKQAGIDNVLINRGVKHGISEGMPVITEEEVLVGIVDEVFPNFCRVALISDEQINFDIEISSNSDAGDGNTIGLARGKGGLELNFEKVSKQDEIKKGFVVLTTNLSGKLPKGLMVGEIDSVLKDDVEPFQTGKISPYFSDIDLNILFIITNYKPYASN